MIFNRQNKNDTCPKSIRTRLFVNFIFVILISVLVFEALLIYFTRFYFYNNVETILTNQIKKIAGVKSGSTKGRNFVVGKLTRSQLKEIAEIKLPDLNCYTVEEAMKIVEGTALNMGIEIVD